MDADGNATNRRRAASKLRAIASLSAVILAAVAATACSTNTDTRDKMYRVYCFQTL